MRSKATLEPERMETVFCKDTKILLNGSPQGRFEHSGVLPRAKLHAQHDGNSEIINS